jgi:hypothetical protein
MIRDLAERPDQVQMLGANARRATETTYGRSHALAAWHSIIEAEASVPVSVASKASASDSTKISSG